jgi:hypothetical protein
MAVSWLPLIMAFASMRRHRTDGAEGHDQAWRAEAARQSG